MVILNRLLDRLAQRSHVSIKITQFRVPDHVSVQSLRKPPVVILRCVGVHDRLVVVVALAGEDDDEGIAWNDTTHPRPKKRVSVLRKNHTEPSQGIESPCVPAPSSYRF